jgi:hypothetical protein
VVQNAIADDVIERLSVELRRLIEIQYGISEVRQPKSFACLFDEWDADVGPQHTKTGLSGESEAVLTPSASDFENAARER